MVSIASGSIGSSVIYEGLVVRMVVRFSFGISQFMEKMHVLLRVYMYRTKQRNGICRSTLFSNVSCVLEERYGGLVGTKALGEVNGPCLL